MKHDDSYQKFFLMNPAPMWLYELETLKFLAVNDAAVRHYGYSREEFLGLTIKDIRPPEDVPTLLEEINTAGDGLDYAGTWRHIKKNGELISVEITSYRLEFEGRLAELVMAIDVTERVKNENALRSRLAVENAITDISSQFISTADIDAALHQRGRDRHRRGWPR